MQTKSVLYAAVGAPVVAAKAMSERVGDLRQKLASEKTDLSKSAEKAIANWAAEGEKVVTRITEGKVVDEITAKVDFDQAKEQVTKLRDQLEDMIATWRHSFRPDRPVTTSEPTADEVKATTGETPAAKKPAAKKPAAKKAGTKTSAAKTTRSTAAKTSAAKTSTKAS